MFGLTEDMSHSKQNKQSHVKEQKLPNQDSVVGSQKAYYILG